jgi:hypothetical protein
MDDGVKAASTILLDPEPARSRLGEPPDARAFGKSPGRAATGDPGCADGTVRVTAPPRHREGHGTSEQRFNCTSFTAGKSYTDVHKYGVLSVREISGTRQRRDGPWDTLSRSPRHDRAVRFGRKTESSPRQAAHLTSLAGCPRRRRPSIGYEVGEAPPRRQGPPSREPRISCPRIMPARATSGQFVPRGLSRAAVSANRVHHDRT